MNLQCIHIKIIVSMVTIATSVAGLVYKIMRDNKSRIVLEHGIRPPGKKRSIIVKNIGEVDIKNIVIDCPNNNVQLEPFIGNEPYKVELLCSHKEIPVRYNVCAGKGERIIRARYRTGLIKKSITIIALG